MKNLKKTFLLFFTVSTTSMATPSLDSKCGFTIADPANSNGVIFDESCTIAYVMPPRKGAAEIGSLARTTNLQFCPAVKSVGETVKRTVTSMNVISEKVEQMLKDLKPFDTNLVDKKIEVETAKAKMQSKKQRFSETEVQLAEFRNEMANIRKEYSDCLVDNASEHSACNELKTALEIAKSELNDFRLNEYRTARNEADSTKENFEILSSRYLVDYNRYVDAVRPMVELQKSLIEINNRITDIYYDYAKLEGAIGQITWSIAWDEILESYRQLNSKIAVEWQRLPIKSAQFFATAKLPQDTSGLANLSAVKSLIIPGAMHSGFAGMGSGNKIDGTQFEPSSPTEASLAFGGSVGGQIVLSLLGACPYFENIKERTGEGLGELSEIMSANLIYNFELAVRRGYIASYNLSSLLQKIEEKTHKGGLFSVSDAHTLIEDNDSSSWFSISFSGNSSEFKYTPNEQQEITLNVKRELFDRAIQQFAVLNAGASQPPVIPSHQQTGAGEAAQQLRKCWHWYCQAGSILLGISNSIWGKSNAVVNFHRNNNTWATDKVNGIYFVDRSASLTFTGKKP